MLDVSGCRLVSQLSTGCLNLAKLTPFSWLLLSSAFVSGICSWNQHIIFPHIKFLNGQFIVGYIAFPWLYDSHPHTLYLVFPGECSQCAKGVYHHLCIANCTDLHTLAILEVDDLHQAVTYDDSICRAKRIWYEVGEVKFLLYEQLGILGPGYGFPVLIPYDGLVHIGAFLHLHTAILLDAFLVLNKGLAHLVLVLSFLLRIKQGKELVLAQSMGAGAFLRIYASLVLDGLLKPC